MSNISLYRSNQNCMIAGVMGGIAERYGWDVTVVRIVFVLASLFLGAVLGGILVYIILWFLMPKRA